MTPPTKWLIGHFFSPLNRWTCQRHFTGVQKGPQGGFWAAFLAVWWSSESMLERSSCPVWFSQAWCGCPFWVHVAVLRGLCCVLSTFPSACLHGVFDLLPAGQITRVNLPRLPHLQADIAGKCKSHNIWDQGAQSALESFSYHIIVL